jgi:hypothetical protein
MYDPGLQRLPPTAVREELERRQHEIEAEVEHNRELHAARAARRKRGRIRSALSHLRNAISRRH